MNLHFKKFKPLCFLLIIAALAVLFLPAKASALELPGGEDPFRLAVPQGVEYNPGREPYGSIYGFPVLRLWGWSADGKVAWSTASMVAGRGGAVVRYVIQSMKTDEVVWSLDDDTYNWGNEGAEADGKSLDEIAALSFDKNKETIAAELGKHTIKGEKNSLEAFPLEWSGETYTPALSIEDEEEPEFWDKIAGYTLFLAKKGGKIKKLASFDEVIANEVHVCGYTSSPFEERVAVIVAEERFVFEGTELFYSLVGCDMTRGF